MVSHMKTTIDISDPLMTEAKAVAARDRTTLRALIEEGLRRVLGDRRKSGRFRVRKASFRGKGLQPQVGEGRWDRIRDIAYEGRGA